MHDFAEHLNVNVFYHFRVLRQCTTADVPDSSLGGDGLEHARLKCAEFRQSSSSTYVKLLTARATALLDALPPFDTP
jgi:hypothetical protein